MSDAKDDGYDSREGDERAREELRELEGRAAVLRAALGEPPLVPASGDDASRDHDAPPLLLVHRNDDPADHPGHRVGCARLGRGGGVAHCTCGVIWTATERRGGVRVGDVTRGGLTIMRDPHELQQELGALRVLVSGLFHGIATHVNQTAPQGLDAAGQLQWALLRVREMAERWAADQLTYEQAQSSRDAWRAAYEEAAQERDRARRALAYAARRADDLAKRIRGLTAVFKSEPS